MSISTSNRTAEEQRFSSFGIGRAAARASRLVQSRGQHPSGREFEYETRRHRKPPLHPDELPETPQSLKLG